LVYREVLRDSRTDSYIRSIKDSINPQLQLVIVILPQQKKDLYDAVKKLCCVDSPIPSQCIVSRTLSKRQMLMSVATKIALQINCKLGGELWALEIPVTSSFA
jgi:aubergine-like protein